MAGPHAPPLPNMAGQAEPQVGRVHAARGRTGAHAQRGRAAADRRHHVQGGTTHPNMAAHP
eukprot:4171079-Prymnesium_polylepis.2